MSHRKCRQVSYGIADPREYEEPIWEESIEPGVQTLTEGGSLFGNWVLHVRLIDACRDKTLLEYKFSWSGTISTLIVQRKWNDESGTYELYLSGYNYPLVNWMRSLLPEPVHLFLDKYERKHIGFSTL